MSIESVMLSNHLILCHSLLFLPSISPSIRVFSSESTLCLRWPKYWVFSFSISLSNEYSGLISFRIDWFDIFAVQRTLKSLPHHHNLKASITSTWPSLWLTIALTRQTFVGKVLSLLFNTLSRFVMVFFSRSKCLLNSWLQSPFTMILEPKKINKICQCFHFFPFYLP